MRESALDRKVKKLLKDLKLAGYPVKGLKIHGSAFMETGTPDWHVTVGGVSFWLEGKVGKNTTSKIQDVRLSEWSDAGAVVGVFYSLDEFRSILEEHAGQYLAGFESGRQNYSH